MGEWWNLMSGKAAGAYYVLLERTMPGRGAYYALSGITIQRRKDPRSSYYRNRR